jgi:hypothetical protein
VPSSPRHLSAALGALLAVVLAGCQRSDPEVVPYGIRLADAGGAPILATVDGVVAAVEGPATRVGPGELRVQDQTLGLVNVTFDAAAHPGVAFPARLDGQPVRVHAQHLPDAVAPGGRPVPYPALRVALIVAGASSFQFVLAEAPQLQGRDVPVVPRPLGPEPLLGDDPNGFPDFPTFAVATAHSRFEVAECGLIYHDVLDVEGQAIQAGQTARTDFGDGSAPWTTLHVDSWHRVGSCPGRSKTWTQWAAWR